MAVAPPAVDPRRGEAGPRPAASAASAPERSAAAEPAVPAGFRFKGLMIFRGEVQIDGEASGEIEAQGILRLGEAARVRARVQADELIIAGEFVGDATARSRIALLATARVRGNLEAPRIALADGCLFLGRCRSGPRLATTPATPSGPGPPRRRRKSTRKAR